MAGYPGQDGVIGPTGAPVISFVLFLMLSWLQGDRRCDGWIT